MAHFVRVLMHEKGPARIEESSLEFMLASRHVLRS